MYCVVLLYTVISYYFMNELISYLKLFYIELS